MRRITTEELLDILTARDNLRRARDLLKRAGAKQAARYVSRCLKSVEGAARHAGRMIHQQGD